MIKCERCGAVEDSPEGRLLLAIFGLCQDCKYELWEESNYRDCIREAKTQAFRHKERWAVLGKGKKVYSIVSLKEALRSDLPISLVFDEHSK